MFGLTPKEIIELRLKCLEPYVITASKAGIEQNTVLKNAEKAWQYAIQPLIEDDQRITDRNGQPVDPMR